MKISLHKDFGENLITRNSLISFFLGKVKKQKDDEVILDFKNIKFISRSCAAEYIKLREKSTKDISEVNMSSDVKSMFKVIVNQLKNIEFNLPVNFDLSDIRKKVA